MVLQAIELVEKQPNKASVSFFGYECAIRDHGGGGHPRCLATLPHNIEELVQQFKLQENENIKFS